MQLPSTPDDTTPAWLESTLRGGSRYPTARVRRLSVEQIGVGYGLDGTSARVRIEGTEVPTSLVLKWARRENALREIHFYRQLAPTARVRVPELLGWQIDDGGEHGVLALSDISPARQGDTVVGATREDADRVATAMADLHSVYWSVPKPEGLAPQPRWCSDGPVMAEQVEAALPAFHAHAADALPPAALRLSNALPDRIPETITALSSAHPTLIHADLHLDNVLFIPDGDPVFLDWPSACVGAPTLDLARLLIEGLTRRTRRDWQAALLGTYVARLASHDIVADSDRIAADLSRVALLLFGAGIRWAAMFEEVPAPPRARLVMQSLLRRSAAAALDPL